MKNIIYGGVLAVVVFFLTQTFLPFPYGPVLGVIFGGLIVWYAKKHSSIAKDSLLNYRRVDPINKEEKDQNNEALRILEKKYVEEKISKEEYLKRKKEFEYTEYNPRKCKVCDSEEFEFISEEGTKESREYSYDFGYYKCKRCGQNEN